MAGNTGNNMASQNEPDADDEITTLRELIKTTKRRLFQRELQAARYGINAEPVIFMEIEDLKREIAGLEKQLKALGG